MNDSKKLFAAAIAGGTLSVIIGYLAHFAGHGWKYPLGQWIHNEFSNALLWIVLGVIAGASLRIATRG